MSTSTATKNLTLQIGATFDQKIYFLDPCKEPIDLTGYTAAMQARYKLSDATPFLDLTTENGGITLGGVTGLIELFAAAADTDDIEAGDGVYDLRLTSFAGDVTFLIEGRLLVQQMVTR